jgi:polyisoprenoid-binding protein YceI
MTFTARLSRRFVAWLAVMLALAGLAAAQDAVLNFDAAHTTVNFTLGDVLHTVHGSFALKRGMVRFNPATGAVSGELVVDAASGDSGNKSRDRKMHREILESARFAEVSFRPDRAEGTVAAQGTSPVQVHGVFRIHGVEHEMVMPAQVELAADHWAVNARFSVPYVLWGMKNPSTFVLRVEKTVEIEVRASGESPWVGR